MAVPDYVPDMLRGVVEIGRKSFPPVPLGPPEPRERQGWEEGKKKT